MESLILNRSSKVSNHLNLVANFSGNIRRETLGGRKFIVAPLTMIVPGVLNGSQGPLYYPEDEVVASTPHWDGIILTDDHLPSGVNGKRIKTQQEYALGYVQNPTIKNNRLMAEGWFDVDRTRRLNPNILNALEQGDKIELSTGLNVDFDNTSGVHNGRSYSQVVRKYRPDHLAVLIGKRGACNITDGCGINNEEDNMLDQDELDTEDFDLDIEQDNDVDNEWSPAARQAAELARKARSQTKNPTSHVDAANAHKKAARAYTKLGNTKKAAYHTATAKKHMAIHKMEREIDPGDSSDRNAPGVYNEEDTDVDNAWSDAARKAAALTRSRKAKQQIKDSGHTIKFRDVGAGTMAGIQGLVYKNQALVHTTKTYPARGGGSKAVKEIHKHLVTEGVIKNATTLPSDSSGKVIKKTKKKVMPSDCSDKQVTNNKVTKENKMALTDAQKNELIDNVINNCACYTEDDRVELSDLDDRMLSSIANGIEAEVKDKKAKETVNNAAPTVIDIKALPVEVQRVLNYGAAAIQRDKEVLIDKLVANQATDDAKKARKEVLSKLSLEELQDRVSDLPAEKVDNSVFDMNRLIGNFSGAAAGGYKVANESGPAGGQLGTPDIQWNKN